MQALTIIAGVLAVASLLVTLFFVHDRRLRLPGLLLSTGLLCLIVSRSFHDPSLAIALVVLATILVVVSGALSLRVLRAGTD